MARAKSPFASLCSLKRYWSDMRVEPGRSATPVIYQTLLLQ
jgi:hypothetical protein